MNRRTADVHRGDTLPFTLTYLYDDFDFLGRALAFRWGDLLPDKGTLYWRPLSREGYFGVLALLDPSQALWGHLGNALLLVLSTLLVVALGRKLAGVSGGMLAGILFASIGPLPTLIGWVSCSQDVFAIVFVLAALLFQMENRLGLASGAMGLALLSKETSLAFIPALVLLRPLLGRTPYRLRASLISYGLVFAAWAVVHPGIHVLLARRFESAGSTLGSLTLSGADRWGSMARSLATLGNLPVVAPSATPWPAELTGLGIAAALLAAAGLWWLHSKERTTATPLRVSLLGALLTLPAILLISLLVKRWQPYYIVLASIGRSPRRLCRSEGPPLRGHSSRRGVRPPGDLVSGNDLGSGIPTERNMRPLRITSAWWSRDSASSTRRSTARRTCICRLKLPTRVTFPFT